MSGEGKEGQEREGEERRTKGKEREGKGPRIFWPSLGQWVSKIYKLHHLREDIGGNYLSPRCSILFSFNHFWTSAFVQLLMSITGLRGGGGGGDAIRRVAVVLVSGVCGLPSTVSNRHRLVR